MSSKTSTIVIRPAPLGTDTDEFLGHLGYERRRSKDASFGAAGSGSLWLGTIDDRIIVYTYLAADFFDGFVDGEPNRDFTLLRDALFRHFPEMEIAAFLLDGRIDAWGYAVFRGGALIRRFYGYDGLILGDEGSQLPAEKEYFANCDRIEVDGETLYRNRSARDHEPYSLAQHGSEVLHEVWRSFTGHEFHAREIFDIPGRDFFG